MSTKPLAGLSLALMIAAVLPACAADEKTIADVLTESKEHKILLEALSERRLIDALKDGEWTVFAPTDAAFKAVDEATAKKLADKATLKTVLQGHIVKGKLSSADLVKLDGKEIATLSGAKFRVVVEGKNVLVGGAKVSKPDVPASNGAVHILDAPLLPK